MALTNAQRQARHQRRVKARLALAAMVETFQQRIRNRVAEAGGDPDCSSAVSAHVGQLMSTQEGAEMLLPFLAQALGVPVMPEAEKTA